MKSKVIIIGAGCAGLTAAIYCARAELKPIVFAGSFEHKGGLLMKTSIVENYPGFSEGVWGADLVQSMEKQALLVGSLIIDRDVVSIDVSSRPFSVTDDAGDTYQADSIIIAVGSSPNKLGLPDEDRLWGKGISSCAVCDGALYRNKKIVVVGGGDSAIEEALFLTKFSDVILIHRRDTLRASKIMQKRLFENPRIRVLFNHVIKSFCGSNKLESITIENVVTNEQDNIPVNGLFYGLGLTPNTDIFKGIVDMDSDGYIIKKPYPNYETMASVEGIFVAGDANDRIYRQAVIACGDGCKAAMDANNYLSELE